MRQPQPAKQNRNFRQNLFHDHTDHSVSILKQRFPAFLTSSNRTPNVTEEEAQAPTGEFKQGLEEGPEEGEEVPIADLFFGVPCEDLKPDEECQALEPNCAIFAALAFRFCRKTCGYCDSKIQRSTINGGRALVLGRVGPMTALLQECWRTYSQRTAMFGAPSPSHRFLPAARCS